MHPEVHPVPQCLQGHFSPCALGRAFSSQLPVMWCQGHLLSPTIQPSAPPPRTYRLNSSASPSHR